VECLIAVCRTKSKVTYRISLKSWSSVRSTRFHHSQGKPRANVKEYLRLLPSILSRCIPVVSHFCSSYVADVKKNVYWECTLEKARIFERCETKALLKHVTDEQSQCVVMSCVNRWRILVNTW